MFNGFKRNRGSLSAKQATIAYTSSQDAYPSDVEVDCQSIDSFGDIRVLNNPGVEPTTNTDVAISDTLASVNEGGFNVNEEITSDELAILSTASSSASVSSLDQMAPEVCPVRSGNSQKIEEWCTKNERAGETVFPGDLTWRQDVGDNFTHPLVNGLSKNQISTVRRISEELLPLLRQTRQDVRKNGSKFPHRYKDIPSVFYMRPSPSHELHRCSQDNNAFANKSWLGWAMVPRFTESNIGSY